MSASKQKGTTAESAVVAYLRGCGVEHAERRALHGSADLGDIAGIPGVIIEVKAHRTFALSEWVDQMLAAVRRVPFNDQVVGVVWHKRRGKGSPADWYVTMTGEQLMWLLDQAGYLPVGPPEQASTPYPAHANRSAG